MLQLKTAVTLALAILPDAAQSFDTSDFLAATITPQSVALRLSMRSTPNIAIKQGVQNFYASQVIMGSDEKNLTSIYQDLVSKVLKYKEYPAWNSAVKSVIPKDEHDVTGQFEKNHTYTMWPTSSGLRKALHGLRFTMLEINGYSTIFKLQSRFAIAWKYKYALPRQERQTVIRAYFDFILIETWVNVANGHPEMSHTPLQSQRALEKEFTDLKNSVLKTKP